MHRYTTFLTPHQAEGGHRQKRNLKKEEEEEEGMENPERIFQLTCGGISRSRTQKPIEGARSSLRSLSPSLSLHACM
jgi:hypothetical protein